MFPDSDVKVVKNREQPKLFQVSNSAETSTSNGHNSQAKTDIRLIPAANERYRSLVVLIKFS
jgi:hypothetical protein